MNEFHANGKLLLTGEYVVLDGAKAIGLPTKIGQKMVVYESEKLHSMEWIARLHDGSVWFNAEFDTNSFEVLQHSDIEPAATLSNILKVIANMNPKAICGKSFNIETQLEFPKDWGLGSSSTLMALLSKVFDINPYDLLAETFGGSGYDIACAMMPRPQTFQLTKKDRKLSFINLNPEITQHIYFIYLNQKQDSREGIKLYKSKSKDERLIKSISELSDEIIKCDNLYDFEDLIHVHEQLISMQIEIEPVKNRLFPDYRGGEIKSLGAWGGDFILVTSESGDLSYFKNKGYDVILSYEEMIG